MEVVARSRDRVEALLANLEEAYGSFPVTQQTVSVSHSDYEWAAERCREGVARVDVHITNDAGEVLLAETGDGLTAPGALVESGEPVAETATEAVRERCGVDCRIEDLAEVTVVGVQDESDREAEPVYRLAAIVDGTQVAGTPAGDCQWAADPPESQLVI